MNQKYTKQFLGISIMIFLSGWNFYQQNKQYQYNDKILSSFDRQEQLRQKQFDLFFNQTNEVSKSQYDNNSFSQEKKPIKYLELQLFNKINEYRLENGLNPLELDNRISKIAQNYSIKMARDEVPFGDSNIESRSATIKEFMPYQSIKEAISYNFGYPDPTQVTVDSWISDPRFIDILQGDFKYTGVGVGISSTGEYYLTQIFVAPVLSKN